MSGGGSIPPGFVVHDKISVAALALSGVSLLVVLMTSAPESPKSDTVANVERIVLMVSSESDAAAEEQEDLETALAHVAEMHGRFDAKASGAGPGPAVYATEATKKEVNARWKEFEGRLKVIGNILKSRSRR